ncbi:hypothetical protein [Maribacter luteus]|uniref:Uncharacterized protein n=1 Tax=Maribacter luteus TaxID=2594478 RepID=A0A6I2MIH7_9FLAO|nr:hypothetical protein [Maribacter luteus]MRX62952.1 hypothetical protein [Maribacter luteus]
MTSKIIQRPYWVLFWLLISITACKTQNPNVDSTLDKGIGPVQGIKYSGGSSGMEQIADHSYLVVYDSKRDTKKVRLGLIKVTDKSISVSPIQIHQWDKEGISNDLESICAVPGKDNEFLLAESGNWEGRLGRIFHIKVDTLNLNATVLGSVKIPMLYRNDMNSVGDQYEAIMALPYDHQHRIIILGERGGSKNNPHGVVRWGLLDIDDHTFQMSKEGKAGIGVNVHGQWAHKKTKRDITDFHVDPEGGIWAAASEDPGDTGPFYSVIYKLGQVNLSNKERPFTIFSSIDIFKNVNGFKIEALSGPCKGIMGSHSFGTEDEIYGGVWRPINIE